MKTNVSWEVIEKEVNVYMGKMQAARDRYLSLVHQLNVSHDESKKEKLKYVFSFLNPDHIHHKGNVIKLAKHYNAGISFRSLLSEQKIRRKYISSLGVEVTPDANDKVIDSKVFQAFGINVPDVYAVTESFDEALAYEECVIKAQGGSSGKGVFVKKGQELRHVFDGKIFSQLEFKEMWLRNGAKPHIVEELVGYNDGPARDIKVYCFYGVAGLVLEVDRSSGSARYCEYNRDGDKLETGRYVESRFLGSGVPNEVVIAAEEVSKQIPSPFVRLDFLLSNDGVYGGEITANPGSFHLFNCSENRRLGVEFIKAEARLFGDLVNGKRFDVYFETVS